MTPTAINASGTAAWRAPLDTALLIAALIGAWQLLHLVVGADALPSPLAATERLAHLMASPDFAANAGETGRAFGYALLISLCGGLGVGVLLGANRLTGDVFEPLLVTLYSIPKITLYPVILLLFGLGMSAKVAFGALHGIIPVVLFTMNAVRNVNRSYLRTGRAMRLTPAQTAWFVLVPATLPEIFSGLRIGFSLTLLGTMLGELFASQRGLGFLLMTAIDLHDVKTILAIAIFISIFAVALNSVMLAVDRRLHWRTAHDPGSRP
jgi:NitT/TauT family transport system permease protein